MRRALAPLVVLSLLIGCAGQEPDGASAAAGDTTVRVVMLGAGNEPLDYGSAQSYFPWVVLGNACDSLVTLDDGEPTLSLADSIEPSGDARTWTITIRDDAAFHDGAAVTADDVAASLAALASSPGFASFYEPVAEDSIEVVDDHTLVVELTTPRADFVETILSAASIVTKDVGDELPMCSGPFELTSFSPDTGAVLVANPDHWGGQPGIARLEIRSVPDPTARVNALRSGAAEYALDLPATAAAVIDGEPGLEVLREGFTNAHALYFVLNTRVPPLDDVEVRRALAAAIDRDQMVDLVIGPDGTVGSDLFGMGLPGYADHLAPRDRDVEAARATLTDAGVDRLTLVAGELTPGLTAASELLRQQLADVGVELEIDEVDGGQFFADLDRLHGAHLLTMYAANRSPLGVIPQIFGDDDPFAFSGWYPPELVSVLDAARSEVADDTRATLVDELQQLQWDEVPNLIWGYRDHLSGVRSGLEGVTHSQGVPLFAEASFAPDA